MPILFKDGIAKGEYIVTYKAEYDGLHPEKKLILGSYSTMACDIILLDAQEFTDYKFE